MWEVSPFPGRACRRPHSLPWSGQRIEAVALALCTKSKNCLTVWQAGKNKCSEVRAERNQSLSTTFATARDVESVCFHAHKSWLRVGLHLYPECTRWKMSTDSPAARASIPQNSIAADQAKPDTSTPRASLARIEQASHMKASQGKWNCPASMAQAAFCLLLDL